MASSPRSPRVRRRPAGWRRRTFRLGSTERRYDRATDAWIDGNTNWFTVQGYRQLAGNIGCSIKKGQRVIVMGRLKMRSWEHDGRIYHVAEIDAESVGHDLTWGSANFIRTAANGPQAAAGPSGPRQRLPRTAAVREARRSDQDYEEDTDDDTDGDGSAAHTRIHQ